MNKSDVKMLRAALRQIAALCAATGNNLLHNYAWREHIQINDLEQILNTPVMKNNRITGADFSTQQYKNGELKSCKGERSKTTNKLSKSKCKFEFDKQNDPIRAQQTQKYDCLMFTIFEGYNPDAVVHIVIRSNNAIKEFNAKVRSKQIEFNNKLQESLKAGRRGGRDSICFDYYDIKSMTSCEFFDANRKSLTREQFNNLFH